MFLNIAGRPFGIVVSNADCGAIGSGFESWAGRRVVLLARWIVRSVPLEIVGSSGHEKESTREKPGLERRGRPREEMIE
ncbi:hypothetical protein TNCV_871201 [Trichonephila clavipes]|nr:hypothetical protein TNCV_871201 [Trichonephila clavipes]